MCFIASLLCLLFVANVHGKRTTCSGIDINERSISADTIRGKWYIHFNEDNTPFAEIVPTDAKFTFIPVGNVVLEYFSGRSKNGSGCISPIFINRPREPDSPCNLVTLVSPEQTEPVEFVLSLLPGDDKIVLAFCGNPPYCTTYATAGITRRKKICRGERELFNNKLREWGFPVRFTRLLRPASNDCKFPGVERLDPGPWFPRCERRKRYRY